MSIILILVLVVVIFVIFKKSHLIIEKPPTTSKNVVWNYPPINITNSSSGIELMQRDDWNANLPENIPNKLKHPLDRVIIYHTYEEISCRKRFDCIQAMKNMQEKDFQRGYGDIGFNFMLGGDGRVYVGVGWDYVGCHLPGMSLIWRCIVENFGMILILQDKIIKALELLSLEILRRNVPKQNNLMHCDLSWTKESNRINCRMTIKYFHKNVSLQVWDPEMVF